MRLSERLARLGAEERAGLANKLAVLPAIQRRLWTASQLAPDTGLYNVGNSYRLRGPLKVDALRRALDVLYERHAGLRSVVVDLFDLPRLVRLPAAQGFPLEEYDLTGCPPAQRQRAAEQRLGEVGNRPFDLVDGPLVRAALIRCDPQDWLFTIVMHHLVCDGESVRQLWSELALLYAGADRADLPPAVDPAVSALALERRADPRQRDEDLAYWRRQLADVPVRPVLPTDRPRRAAQQHRGARMPVPLDAAWATEVRAFAATLGASLFDAALATLATVLARFGALADVTIGTTVDVRADAGAERAVGFFMRTVPLRLPVDLDAPVADLVREAHQVVVGALTHSGVEFDEIVAALGRSGSTAPLFQVAVELHQDDDPPELAGLAVQHTLVTDCMAKFDLTFHLSTSPGQSFVEYSTQLYDEQTVRSLAEAVAVALRALPAPDRRRVADLPMLSEAGRARTVALATGEPLADVPQPVPAAVRAWAATHPADLAVLGAARTGDATLDYRTLVGLADTLADRVARERVGPAEPVGICLRRSGSQLVALFGVWFAGAVCVPLDPDLPEARLRAMLDTLGVTAVITDPTTQAHPALTDVRRVAVPTAAGSAVGDVAPGPARPVTGDDLAYVIFTSGTSNGPKPVAVRHGSLAAFGAAMDRLALGTLRPNGVVAANAPVYFDAALQHIQLLRRGHPVLIVDDASRTDPVALLDLLRRHDVRALDCTPTHAEALVGAGLLEPGRTGLELLVLGGEEIRPALWQRLRDATLTVLNVYGPTEFTVNATGCRIDDDHPAPTIGRPLPGTKVEILDDELRPVPPGFPGELYLSGPQLAVGYAGQPGRTAERFRPGPGGSRRYATGDVGRWTASGDIEFRGRYDAQVKLRGYRIELTEVEAALRDVDGVRDAAVAVVGGDGAAQLLAAVLVPEGEAGAAVAAARERAAARLPGYAAPSLLLTRPALPQTRNGKLDRRALAGLVAEATASAAGGSRPTPERTLSGTEERLAKLWHELLGRQVADPDADFFALGGNSLLFTTLLRRINTEFQIEISVHAAIRARTLQAMARAVDTARPARSTALAGHRPPATDRDLAVPLAPGQGPPLVLAHPLGGTLVSYAPLLRLLPPGKPVWGLRSPSVAGLGPEPTRAADLVGRYRDELIRRFGTARVALAGWSLGGLIAVALTAELEHAGCEVLFTEVWDCGLGTADEYSEAELRVLAHQAAYGDDPNAAIGQPVPRQTLDTLRRQTRLFHDWTPRPFRAPLRVVYAAESLRTGVVERTDWTPYARSGWSERVVDTDHHGIVQNPAIAAAASSLIDSLRQPNATARKE